MKRFFIIFVAFFTLVSTVSAQDSEFTGEHIRDYHVDIEVRDTGKISVREEIKYDFGTRSRHGIFRNIPFIKKNSESKKFKMKLDSFTITDQAGNPYQFQKFRVGDTIRLKIGDPDKTIVGTHTYVISYEVSGAITYFSDHDELFWNVVGTDWEVPISSAQARVTLPQADADSYRSKCFIGVRGSTQECTVGQGINTVTFTSPRSLFAGEGMTITTSFPSGLVALLPAEEIVIFWDTLMGKAVIGLLAFVGFLWYVVYPVWIAVKWYKSGRDPRVGPAVRAYYDIPQAKNGRPLTPAEVGTLVDEIVHLRDVTATLVDLARRGYFTINERKKGDFYLEKHTLVINTPQKSGLLPFEKHLITKLFDGKNVVRLKDKKFYSFIREVNHMIYEEMVKSNFFETNPQKTRDFYVLIGIIGLITLNMPLAFVSFIFGRAMPKKTWRGAVEANKAMGLKNFLASQKRHIDFEADMSTGKNKQVVFQGLFEKFLPYAMAFGVEERWIKRFSQVKLTEPQWYRTYGVRAFSANAFGKSLNSSMSAFRASATPTSSGSGFSSGFSGGSVGGGGGGGGGGSW